MDCCKKENETKKLATESAAQLGDSQMVHKTCWDIVNERIGYDPRAGREAILTFPRQLDGKLVNCVVSFIT